LSPWPPVDGHDPAGPAAVELVREPTEDLAGSGIVGLPAVSEASGDRAEEDQEAQALRAKPVGQHHGRAGLGGHHPTQGGQLLVRDQPVLANARAVQHAVDPAVALVHRVDEGAELGMVRDVAHEVLDVYTRCTQALDVLARLASAQDALAVPL